VSFNKQLQLETTAKLAAVGLSDVECYTVHSLAANLLGTPVPDTLSLVRALQNASPSGDPFTLVCVDEAQDVGPVMVDVLALVTRLDPEVQWVVVGDVRQEIYTFTGHAGDSLMSAPETKLGRNSRAWTLCALNETYRMTPAIVAALNSNYRGPNDPPLVAVRAATAQDPVPQHLTMPMAEIHTVVLEMLSQYSVDEVAVLAPSVRSDIHGALTLAETLVERDIKVHSTHARDATVSSEVLANKLFISTYHQAKGREWDAVVVLGADSRLAADCADAMYAPLHVALTRARTRLVVITAPRAALFPTTTSALPGFVRSPATRPPDAVARPRGKCPGWIKKYSMRWPIDFAADNVLKRAARTLMITCECEHVTVPDGPASTIVAGATTEMVLHYYPQAIVARAAALLGEEDPTQVAPLKQPGSRRARMVGPLLTEAQRALTADTISAQQWLAVTSVCTAIRSGIRHPLKQLPSTFEWVDADYIEREAEGLAAALAGATSVVFGQWLTRECDAQQITLQCTVPIATSTTLEAVQLPWRYSSSSFPTEQDVLLSAVAMWLTRGLAARVYCRGRVFAITASTAQDRDALLELCFANKRR
jgi:hypothetical protein